MEVFAHFCHSQSSLWDLSHGLNLNSLRYLILFHFFLRALKHTVVGMKKIIDSVQCGILLQLMLLYNDRFFQPHVLRLTSVTLAELVGQSSTNPAVGRQDPEALHGCPQDCFQGY